MRFSLRCCLYVLSMSFYAVVFPVAGAAEETGELHVRFQFEGELPEPAKPALGGPFCGAQTLVDESLLVDPKSRGVQNVVVYFDNKKNKLDLKPRASKVCTVANAKCRFEPHMTLLQIGDTLEITNPDPVGHNAKLDFFDRENPSVNPLIPAGKSVSYKMVASEPALAMVSCSIHPWMNARLMLLDHDLVAFTDKDGSLVIKGIPVGEEIVFRATHEKLKFTKVQRNGDDESWRAARFEVDIQPGVNDLGTVVLGADNL